ncbi:hypothetical protein Tco_1007385, partial [Tanacetum coccineum]
SFEEVKEEFDKLVKQVKSFEPINFKATKDSLKRFGEELQTKTSKRLKSDEAKDDESTKKTGKRRKQKRIFKKKSKTKDKQIQARSGKDKVKNYYSEDQYAVSIKEDTAYPCLHSPKTTEEQSSIHRYASALTSSLDIANGLLIVLTSSYALTATADVPAVYLQQFWKTVSKVPDTKDTIIFKLDTQEIVYTVDMFSDTLKLPVETLDNPFIVPVHIEVIQSFMQRVGYQGDVDKNKDVIHYPRFTKLIIPDLMKKYPSIPPRLEEDYHSIKDDIPLVSVYTTRNVTVRGMLIPDAFLTEEICATDDYKEYETVFVNIVVPMNQPQPVVSIQGTHRTTPRSYRTPTLTAASH